MVKKLLIFIIIAHATTVVWVLFPKTEHKFYSGGPAGVTEQWFVKGFCDCLLRLTYASVICLLIKKYEPRLSVFFYVTFWYYFCNLFLFSYNYCQWKWPFYLLLTGLIITAIKVCMDRGKVVKM